MIYDVMDSIPAEYWSDIEDNVGSVDVTAYVRDAFASYRRLTASAGTYRLQGHILAQHGTHFEAEEQGAVIFRQHAELPDGFGTFMAESASPTTQLRDVSLKRFTIDGRCDASGFEPTSRTLLQHGLTFAGVKNAEVDHVSFRGVRGDAIMLHGRSHATQNNEERHNVDVFLTRNGIDGINKKGRNGISISDGDNVLVEGNVIERTTYNVGGVGGIVVEMDPVNFLRVRNLKIRVNTLRAVGGNGNGVISIVLSDIELLVPVQYIDIIGNTIEACDEHAFLFAGRRDVSLLQDRHYLKLRDNRVTGGGSPFIFDKLYDGVIDGDTYTKTRSGAIISGGCRAVRIEGQAVLDRVGEVTGVGLSVADVSDLTLGPAIARDCGGAGGTAVDFIPGASSNVRFDRFRCERPAGLMTVAVHKAEGHVFDAETNREDGCDFAGLANGFVAAYSRGSFVVELGCDSGSITLSASRLQYERRGRWVSLTGNLMVVSVSSPSGALYIRPLKHICSADHAGNSGLAAVAVYAKELASGACTALQGRVVGSESRIRIQRFSAGSSSEVASEIVAGSELAIAVTYFTDS